MNHSPAGRIAVSVAEWELVFHRERITDWLKPSPCLGTTLPQARGLGLLVAPRESITFRPTRPSVVSQGFPKGIGLVSAGDAHFD
jgi:hypothetical protein